MSPIVIMDRVLIPAWVQDQDSFRRWVLSRDCPEHGWFSYLKGTLWVDPTMEKLKHNKLKGVVAIVVGGLVLAERLGHYLHDRMLLTHLGAELSAEPDGMFFTHQALRDGRVRLEEGEDATEVLGTPDMVLEVISRHSARKDTEILRGLYAEAEIPEYWLVDSRRDASTLEILRLTKRGYTTVRKQDEWARSAVFGKSFRLTQQADEHGIPEYTLAVR
jgi:Uma2 family endonuclease